MHFFSLVANFFLFLFALTARVVCAGAGRGAQAHVPPPLLWRPARLCGHALSGVDGPCSYDAARRGDGAGCGGVCVHGTPGDSRYLHWRSPARDSFVSAPTVREQRERGVGGWMAWCLRIIIIKIGDILREEV